MDATFVARRYIVCMYLQHQYVCMRALMLWMYVCMYVCMYVLQHGEVAEGDPEAKERLTLERTAK